MRSNEAQVAEAVASLTARLTTWGVEEAHEKATGYVNDMLRAGWRPRALPVPEPLPQQTGRHTPPTDEYRAAREALRVKETE